MYNQEYLNQIEKKLDSLNKANGVNPETKKEIFSDNFDIFSSLGNSAIKYMETKNNNHSQIDPLFTDHNTHLK